MVDAIFELSFCGSDLEKYLSLILPLLSLTIIDTDSDIFIFSCVLIPIPFLISTGFLWILISLLSLKNLSISLLEILLSYQYCPPVSPLTSSNRYCNTDRLADKNALKKYLKAKLTSTDSSIFL